MTPDSLLTIPELVAHGTRVAPQGIALAAPGRPSATYVELAEQVERVAGHLQAAGIDRSGRVALVVENGAEAASAFLGVSSASVCAPLNPSYREAELEFYFRDLRAEALVVSASLDTAARDVARALGMHVFDLVVEQGQPAGVFRLEALAAAAQPTLASPPPRTDELALVLHTSGTTARPKIVPLTHGQLLASAGNVARTLDLQRADRCLCVMPLFHIHALVGALLASLRTCGSVACTPGFHQVHVFEWLRELVPTWMTAVPTMYQAIVERAQREPALIEGHRLRFARSSSAALPVAVLEAVETLLDVPVIEAYGMTEAAHQMASNPIHGTRKPGSVGIAAGPEVTVLVEDGTAAAGAGQVGEVAVRGRTVFEGYEANAEANVASFLGEWFRTGDLGRIDEDGYLFLVGRSKEIINRGGEKISPVEIDEVLLRHPAVAQAAAFGVPHERLGEEVAAAVVLHADRTTEERELQDFVAQTVAPYKVPRRVVVVDDIPKGATGKLQRALLPDRLGLVDPPGSGAEPGVSWFLEERLRTVMAEVLALSEVGPNDDFFGLGGDSILGSEVIARTRELIGRPDLPLVTIVRSPTPRTLAAEVEGHYGWDRDGLVPITAGDGDALPLFMIHGVDGDVVRFAAIARLLEPSRGFYGLRAPGHESGETPTDVETLADRYLAEIRRAQSSGPYLIGGLCMGANVALELAHRLAVVGERSALLLIDPRVRQPTTARYGFYLVRRRARQRRLARAAFGRLVGTSRAHRVLDERGNVWRGLEVARDSYICRPTICPVALLRSATYEQRFDLPLWYLRTVFPRIVYAEAVPGDHSRLFEVPTVYGLPPAMGRALDCLECEVVS